MSVPDRTTTRTCAICGGHFGASYTVREMQYGTREPFTYLRCDDCGCLQLRDVPADLSAYYPDEYYSFHQRDPQLLVRLGWLRKYLIGKQTDYQLGARDLFTRALARFRLFPPEGIILHPDLNWNWFRVTGTGRRSRILDVGCGAGLLLLLLNRNQFGRLDGIDPFLAAEFAFEHVRLLRKSMADVDEPYDLVMLHNSLEHMPDQHDALRHVARLLAPGGQAVIRIPMLPCAAWDTYGVDWADLDAPRHLFIHTLDSMRRLTAEAGLAIRQVEYDASCFQFWASELYRRDIPLQQGGTFNPEPWRALFTEEDIHRFLQQAAEWSRQARGATACLYLQRIES